MINGLPNKRNTMKMCGQTKLTRRLTLTGTNKRPPIFYTVTKMM
jgi:hypothetical protein